MVFHLFFAKEKGNVDMPNGAPALDAPSFFDTPIYIWLALWGEKNRENPIFLDN